MIPAMLIALGAALVLTWTLSALAHALGWIDRRDGAEARKPRTQPVPLVGGAAILGAAATAALCTEGAAGLGSLPWVALVAAFVLGLVDDVLPGGLDARAKLLGQVVVALLLALLPGGFHPDLGLTEALVLAGMAVVAMNVVNTWDHADGMTGGLAGVGLLVGAPGLAAAVLGYLPFNTIFRQRWSREMGVPGPNDFAAPRAMLGDAGSHMLGVALVAVPGAAWFLLVPALDLARVARTRIARGQPFWVGDRTHLGHRIERLGIHPTTGAAIAALVVTPPMAALGLSTDPALLAATLLVSATLYFGLLALTDLGAPSEIASDERQEQSVEPAALLPGPEPEGQEGAAGGDSAGPFARRSG